MPRSGSGVRPRETARAVAIAMTGAVGCRDFWLVLRLALELAAFTCKGPVLTLALARLPAHAGTWGKWQTGALHHRTA